MKKPKAKQNLARHVETPRPTNLQALKFIDSIVGMAPANRQTHVQAQAALRQISGALGELEQLKSKKPEGQK